MITTVIGAYPKPPYLLLQDWFNAKGGTDTVNPTADYIEAISKMGNEAETIFLKATKEAIKDQIECGIDIVTDGEMRRENYIHYHCRHLSGFNFNKLTKKVARTGNYECWLPTVINKIEAKESFLVHDWNEAQKLSSRPVKVTIPGPMTITDTVANEYYTSNKQMGQDLASAINIEIKRLVDSGCKYIQVDEPLFARKYNEANEYGLENLEKCFESITEKDVETIVIGLPKRLNGEIGIQAEKVQGFSRRLEKNTKAKIVFWDERLTTVEAERIFQTTATNRKKKRKKVVDQIAAVLILEGYLSRFHRPHNLPNNA